MVLDHGVWYLGLLISFKNIVLFFAELQRGGKGGLASGRPKIGLLGFSVQCRLRRCSIGYGIITALTLSSGCRRMLWIAQKPPALSPVTRIRSKSGRRIELRWEVSSESRCAGSQDQKLSMSERISRPVASGRRR